MNPGTLDRKLLLQRQADGLALTDAAGNVLTDAAGDELLTGNRRGRFGAEEDNFGLWKTRMARRIQNSGSEATGSGREIGQQTVVYRLRYTAGLTLTDRAVEDGQVYDIIDIKEIGRRHLHEITCVLHANTRPA